LPVGPSQRKRPSSLKSNSFVPTLEFAITDTVSEQCYEEDIRSMTSAGTMSPVERSTKRIPLSTPVTRVLHSLSGWPSSLYLVPSTKNSLPHPKA
uniref:PDE4_UCR domain-containing protein n=1 Tax=Gongylonema pulchrum TaxID=637853 RepID=A0A183DWN4_9BILA